MGKGGGKQIERRRDRFSRWEGGVRCGNGNFGQEAAGAKPLRRFGRDLRAATWAGEDAELWSIVFTEARLEKGYTRKRGSCIPIG